MHLVKDPLSADLIVDLSNVCSRDLLPPPGEVRLGRLGPAVGTFERTVGIRDAGVLAVADRSLFARLTTTDDKSELRQLEQSGLVEQWDGADPRILELVELTGLPAMTWDRYGGHRKEFPWVQGDTEHFVAIERAGERLILVRRDMGYLEEHDISRRAEIDDLKAAHLLNPSGKPDASVLTRWWRCPEPRCSLFGPSRDRGQPIPVRQRGAVLCSLHRSPLSDDGARPAEVQLVATNPDGQELRCTLRAGDGPVVVGRGPEAGGWDVSGLLAPGDRGALSRSHLRAEITSEGLLVADLGSTNGTSILARNRPPQPLTTIGVRPLRVGEQLELPGGLLIRTSGRRFHALALEARALQPRADEPPTRRG